MKTGYITDAVKILIFAATVIITCILIWLGFQAADTAREISDSAVKQMTDLNNDIQNSDIKMYDDAEVEGSEVVNLLKKQLGDYSTGETASIYIYIKTTISENTYTNDAFFLNIKNFTDIRYIKPTALFTGKVVINPNKVIIGLSFIQK